ncbi:MAG TPA: hypothetical protein VK783_00975 [Bacteroidia bacterium]|nr:hypothetical protein [Bacteroidia bacterium]
MERLRCVIVDDDAASMRMLSDFCQDVPFVKCNRQIINIYNQ